MDAISIFTSPECAWMHETLATLDAIYGVNDVYMNVDETGKLTVTVQLDEE